MIRWNDSYFYLLTRYLLGVIMIAYGTIKVVQTQFLLPDEVNGLQLGQLDGVTLTWAFLGFSSWFSVLLGVFEFIPGLLLIFRKTKLIGAILLLPCTLAVFLINMAFDFLPHMKIFTGLILLLNLFLLIPNYVLIKNFVKQTLDRSSTSRTELVLNIFIVGLILLIMVMFSGALQKV